MVYIVLKHEILTQILSDHVEKIEFLTNVH